MSYIENFLDKMEGIICISSNFDLVEKMLED